MKTCPKCRLRYPDETTFCFVDGSTLQAAGDGLQGRTVGGMFVVDEPLGDSPWSSVHRARYRLLGGSCVIKLLTAPLGEAKQQAFVGAVDFSRRYTHPNIAAVLSGGVDSDGTAYVVRQAVDARPLGALLAGGPLGIQRAVSIAVQLLRALGRIHDFGGAHGDLRPSNVLVDAADRAWLVDVGLGRSLHRDLWEPAPEAFASQRYLAPELTAGASRGAVEAGTKADRIGIAGDLYAVGITVAEMLSGKPLVRAENVEQLRAELQEPLPDKLGGALGDAPEALTNWVGTLVERTAAHRPADAHQALHELLPFCERASVELPAEPSAGPLAGEQVELTALFRRWDQYASILKRMVDTGFPSGAPPQTRSGLDAILGRVKDLGDIGKQAQYQYGVLGDTQTRAREGRERLAQQMAELTEQAKTIRSDLQPLKIAADRHAKSAEAFPSQLQELHREVIRWEGRSGFREPYQELAKAYRDVADLVDKWWSVRSAQRTCEVEAKDKLEELSQLERQLEELRQALRIHESNVDAEIGASEEALGALGARLEELEPELLDMATRLAAPLRAKPELSGCFRELEQVAD